MSKRVSWRTMEKLYVHRKYRGRFNSRQMTIKVVDVTMGGDVMVRRRGHSDTCMKQEVFLEFVAWAKDITDE